MTRNSWFQMVLATYLGPMPQRGWVENQWVGGPKSRRHPLNPLRTLGNQEAARGFFSCRLVRMTYAPPTGRDKPMIHALIAHAALVGHFLHSIVVALSGGGELGG